MTKKVHVVHNWLDSQRLRVGRHSLLVMSELDGARPSILGDLRKVVRAHYLDPKVAAQRLASLGAPVTAQLFRERIPTTKHARSGDLGEILATEIAEQQLRYDVPIRRLRWKDGRNTAMRGDDLIGVLQDKDTLKLRLLKGESKSRVQLSSAVLASAGAALDRDRGRPTRHSVLFVADRLREQDDDDLATQLEKAVLKGFRGVPIQHMLFTLCGTCPRRLLTNHLHSIAPRRRVRHAVGVHIKDHPHFITELFRDL